MFIGGNRNLQTKVIIFVNYGIKGLITQIQFTNSLTNAPKNDTLTGVNQNKVKMTLKKPGSTKSFQQISIFLVQKQEIFVAIINSKNNISQHVLKPHIFISLPTFKPTYSRNSSIYLDGIPALSLKNSPKTLNEKYVLHDYLIDLIGPSYA